MNEEKDDIIYLKGKESVIVSILSLIGIIVFIVPIAIVFILRFIYQSVRKAKESVESAQADANLTKVY